MDEWKKRSASTQERLKSAITHILKQPVGEARLEAPLRELHEERARKALTHYADNDRHDHVEKIAELYTEKFERKTFKTYNQKIGITHAEADVPLPLHMPGKVETVENYLNLLCNVTYELSRQCEIEMIRAQRHIKKLEALDNGKNPIEFNKAIGKQKVRALVYANIRTDLNYNWWRGMIATMDRVLDTKKTLHEHYEILVDNLAEIGAKCDHTLAGLMKYDELLQEKENTLTKPAQKEFLNKRREKLVAIADGMHHLAHVVPSLQFMAVKIQNKRSLE